MVSRFESGSRQDRSSTCLAHDRVDQTDPGSYRPLEERGVAEYALDPDNARRLWELSLAALGR